MTRLQVSRIFDWGVVALGAAVTVVVASMLVRDPSRIHASYFLSIPLIMVMGWFPLLIGRTGGGIEIALDACVLIFLANLADPLESLTIWAIGTSLCQLFNHKRFPTKAFNMGLGVVAGGVALLVIEWLDDVTISTVRQLVALSLGAAVYFLVDFVLSGISLWLEEDTEIAEDLAPRGALGPFIAFLAVSSLGYLAAIVVRQLPDWSVVLLIVPVAAILVASRAQSRGGERARRLKVLLDTALALQAVRERPILLETLRTGASDLLGDPRVTLRPDSPRSDEIGVHVAGTDDELWIVGPALNRARSTAEDDRLGLAAIVALANDAFARIRLTDAMTHLAWHDRLTGLPNRSLFLDRVSHAMDMQSQRGGAVAVLFCDLDGFKRVNDLFGHAAGDALLAEVGRRITSVVRQADTVARLGGDEFAALLEDVHDKKDVTRACRRILQALRTPFHVAGESVSVTMTIGIAMSDKGGSADAVLSRADLAMYRAKSRGKNRFEMYRPALGDARRDRIELVENLRSAVEAKDLQVYYQPMIDLASNEIVGVEALVRWRRDGALMPPDRFIPAAEESGLIVGLGDIVLDIVSVDAPHLVAAASHRLSIAVNVSAQQLQLDDFATHVLSARQAMGDVDLILEVAERDFVHHEPRTLAAMQALADADVRFAIDDFGVGFAAMGYLGRLPLRFLKVDKSFLSGIEHVPRASALVRSMVALGDALGVDVVIEGIEHEAQLHHLVQDVGARLGQGDLFGKPMPRDDMVLLLASRRGLTDELPPAEEQGVLA